MSSISEQLSWASLPWEPASLLQPLPQSSLPSCIGPQQCWFKPRTAHIVSGKGIQWIFITWLGIRRLTPWCCGSYKEKLIQLVDFWMGRLTVWIWKCWIKESLEISKWFSRNKTTRKAPKSQITLVKKWQKIKRYMKLAHRIKAMKENPMQRSAGQGHCLNHKIAWSWNWWKKKEWRAKLSQGSDIYCDYECKLMIRSIRSCAWRVTRPRPMIELCNSRLRKEWIDGGSHAFSDCPLGTAVLVRVQEGSSCTADWPHAILVEVDESIHVNQLARSVAVNVAALGLRALAERSCGLIHAIDFQNFLQRYRIILRINQHNWKAQVVIGLFQLEASPFLAFVPQSAQNKGSELFGICNFEHVLQSYFILICFGPEAGEAKRNRIQNQRKMFIFAWAQHNLIIKISRPY